MLSVDYFLLDAIIFKFIHQKYLLSKKGTRPNLELSISSLNDSVCSDERPIGLSSKQDDYIVSIDSILSNESDVSLLSGLIPWIKKDQVIERLHALKNGKPSFLHHPAVTGCLFSQSESEAACETERKADSTPVTSHRDSGREGVKASSRKHRSNAQSDSKITIHVCDEAKGLKQDFECPKNLLVEEMRYFSDYLSPGQQTWEDVDISVHCDVAIFQWLMKYVKRSITAEDPIEELEPTNVISILISSDFLKMDSLVELCVRYCHEHMSAILATPCNMSCLGDHLVTRIASKFSPSEAQDIKDKKDKFKSMIFQKKIELLLDPSSDSPGKGCTLFRCQFCQQLLTEETYRIVPCRLSRACVGVRGQTVYVHESDPQFDLTGYLCDLRADLGSWQGVFWRLWGLVNFMWCTRCSQFFPSASLGHCAYHSASVRYEQSVEDKSTNSIGVYPCCGLKVLRFDPFNVASGCKFRDHVIGNPPDNVSRDSSGDASTLLSKRELICIPPPDLMEVPSFADADVFGNERLLSPSLAHLHLSVSEFGKPTPTAASSKAENKNKSSSSSDDTDDTADFGDVDSPKPAAGRVKKVRKVVKKKESHSKTSDVFVDTGSFGLKKSKRWDATKSLRANQDAQRQEDRRRMEHMIQYLQQLRAGSAPTAAEKQKAKEFSGGIFAKLEHQWKASYGNISGQKIPPMQPK